MIKKGRMAHPLAPLDRVWKKTKIRYDVQTFLLPIYDRLEDELFLYSGEWLREDPPLL